MPILTVVYDGDQDAIDEEWKRIHPLFLLEKGAPLRATAVSADDEMTRVDLIRNAIEEIDDHYDLKERIEEILDAPNVRDLQTNN